MPATPAAWLNDFTVNSTISGTQDHARVTQLANGNILVVWDSTENRGAGSPAGQDVIGQIFNPLGQTVGNKFLPNNAFFVADERAADVGALPDGGFLVAYHRNDDGTFPLSMERYNSTGDWTIPKSWRRMPPLVRHPSTSRR